MTPPAIDIVIPFVRGTEHLVKAIDSVRQQTMSEWTLTVVDNDGDHGDISDLVLGAGDDRIRYHRRDERIPMAENWNRCIGAAESDWVCLLHSDDVWAPGYLHSVSDAIKRSTPTTAAVFTGGSTIDQAGEPSFSLADWYKGRLRGKRRRINLFEEAGLRDLLRGNYVFASSLCVNRALVGSDPYRTDLNFAPDYELLIRLLLEDKSVIGVNEPLSFYRRHAAQETIALTDESRRFEEEIELYRSTATQCKDRGWLDARRTALRHVSLRLNLVADALRWLARGRVTEAARYLRMAIR